MDSILNDLIKEAKKAQAHAHAPYSDQPVGVALLTNDGTIHSGCNVENAAYPLGNCAEPGAIADMVKKGHRYIRMLVVVGPATSLCTPCGGCRQRIREFGNDHTHIYVCDVKGNIMLSTTLGALLPHSFGPENIDETKKLAEIRKLSNE
jgi:cytidine deaminase